MVVFKLSFKFSTCLSNIKKSDALRNSNDIYCPAGLIILLIPIGILNTASLVSCPKIQFVIIIFEVLPEVFLDKIIKFHTDIHFIGYSSCGNPIFTLYLFGNYVIHRATGVTIRNSDEFD